MAVDLALARLHLRVTHEREDGLIQQYLNAAIAWVEQYTGQPLVRRQITQFDAAFAPFFTLSFGPAPENLTITYVGTDGATATITDAIIVRDRVYPLTSWPSAHRS